MMTEPRINPPPALDLKILEIVTAEDWTSDEMIVKRISRPDIDLQCVRAAACRLLAEKLVDFQWRFRDPNDQDSSNLWIKLIT